MLSYGWQPPKAAVAEKKIMENKDIKAGGATLAFRVKNLLSAAKVAHHNENEAIKNGWPRGRKPRKSPHVKTPRPASLIVAEGTMSHLSGKDRLLAIVAAEKAAATRIKVEKAISACDDDSSSSICSASTASSSSSCSKNGSSLFQRGVDSIRRSLRKVKKMSSSSKPNDFSHDSGLGEDSDASHRNSPVTIPTPILRTTRSFSNSGLKHVSIRVPSVRDLPSSLRNSFPGAKPMRPQLVRLEHRINRFSHKAADSLVGDVGPQWGSLYFRASQQVRSCLGYEDSVLCDLIFCPSRRTIEDKLLVMEADEVDETIHLLYKILYHDWLDPGSPTTDQLSIILHCVQNFLVIVVDVCPELEAEDRRRLSICAKGLLRQCEDAKYAPISECLSRTRTLYIQVWCAILCIPFVPN